MTIEPTHGSEVVVEPSVETGIDVNAAENRAAYVLARNVHLIDGWLFAVRRLAEFDDSQFGWTFPNTLLSHSCDSAPTHLFVNAEDALRDLAITGRLDAAVLVEFHRSLDAAAESCALLAELVTANKHEEIRAAYWASGIDIYNATCLLPRIMRSDQDSVSLWFSLGRRTGDLLGDNGFPGYRERCLRTINDIVTDMSRISTVNVDRIQNLPILRRENCEITFEQFKSVGESIDIELMRGLSGSLPTEAWFILDDKRRVLTYLGAEIPYEEFGTSVEFVRVLAQFPQTPLSAATIAEKAKCKAGAAQLPSYLSRFRKVVKATQQVWPSHLQDDHLALNAFIISDLRARKCANSKDAWYKLTLPPHRVTHIPAAEHVQLY